jgi:ABC-type anion transport system duplicated permease subunit
MLFIMVIIILMEKYINLYINNKNEEVENIWVDSQHPHSSILQVHISILGFLPFSLLIYLRSYPKNIFVFLSH